jgi:hypothetical protein
MRPGFSAQILFFPAQGASESDVQFVPLSTAAVGSPDYTNAIPRRIVGSNANSGIIVVDMGGNAVGLSNGVALQ